MRSHFIHFLIPLIIMSLTLRIAAPTAAGQSGPVTEETLRVPDPDEIQIISLNDGSSLVGRIVTVSEQEISFATELGTVTIPRKSIREVKTVPASSLKGGKYWFPNPNRTRLYVAPTGRMLRQGEGYFTDVYLFFPGIAYGITDNITIGGGFSLFPGLDLDEQLLYFTPKLGVSAAGSFALAGGALIVRVPDDDEAAFFGVLYATGTIGSGDESLTLGLGYGFADEELADKPAVLLGGEFRLVRRISFVSENWIVPEVDEPVVSYGLRFFGESMSVDLALFNILGEDALFPGIPFVDFVYNF